MAADFTIGLDIGTSSTKVVVLSHKDKQPKLFACGTVATPSPGLISDADPELEIIAKAIKGVMVSSKAPHSSVVIALPESKIFTRVIGDLPFLSDEELVSAIRYSVEEFVPLPADQVDLYWQVINRSKPQNNTSVFVVASPKTTVRKYIKVLEMAGLTPLALETELVAVARALMGNNPFAPTTMIIQLGSSSTDFAVISKGIIILTRSIGTGGLVLTRSVGQYLNFELSQAEQYKKTYGLLEDQLGGKIFQALKPLVDSVAAEAQRVIQAFQSKYPQNPIKRVILTGGGAKLPGLMAYFTHILGLEVQEADPWSFVEKDPALQAKLAIDAPTYTVAVGLAMREGQ